MVLITIVTGAYKPTYNWGASHCSSVPYIPYLTTTYPTAHLCSVREKWGALNGLFFVMVIAKAKA